VIPSYGGFGFLEFVAAFFLRFSLAIPGDLSLLKNVEMNVLRNSDAHTIELKPQNSLLSYVRR